jgi:hypothetical protein
MTTKDAGVFSIGKELMVKFEENVVQSSSVDPINAHVSVATAFMNRILVERQVCGILTGATYRFFRNGYLLNSSVYNEDLNFIYLYGKFKYGMHCSDKFYCRFLVGTINFTNFLNFPSILKSN